MSRASIGIFSAQFIEAADKGDLFAVQEYIAEAGKYYAHHPERPPSSLAAEVGCQSKR